MHRALGPIVAGLVIDLVDLATFGPLGIFVGFILGGAAGWYLGRFYGYSETTRWWLALIAGIYCTIPMTEFIPLATLSGAVARFFQEPRSDGDRAR